MNYKNTLPKTKSVDTNQNEFHKCYNTNEFPLNDEELGNELSDTEQGSHYRVSVDRRKPNHYG